MKDPEQRRPAQDLPLLVLLRIFQELGPRDIALACSRVSQSWHAAIQNEPSLWRSLCRSRYLIAPPSCPLLSPRASTSTNGIDWRTVFQARFAADRHVLQDLVVGRIQQFRFRLFQEKDPIFEQIDALLKVDAEGRVTSLPSSSLAVAPVAADLLTHLVFTTTFAYPSLGYSAWTLLRHLRWSWILQQLDTPADPSPEYYWSLLSAAQMLHLDPVTQVIRPLLSQLDDLAQEFAASHPNQSSEPPRERLASLGHFLFHTKGFKGNKANYHSPSNSYMHTFLSTRLGLPISLCALLSSVAHRLTPPLPISLVSFPSHFLARFDDPSVPLDKATLLLDPFNYDASRPQSWMATVAHWQQVWAQAGAAGAQLLPQMVEPTLSENVFVRILNNVDTTIKMRLRGQAQDEGLLDVLYVTNSMLLRLDRDAVAAGGGFFAGVGARTMQRIEIVMGLLIQSWHLLDACLVMQSIRRFRGISDDVMALIKSTLESPLSSNAPATPAGSLPASDSQSYTPQELPPEPVTAVMYESGTLFVHKKYGYLAVIQSSDPTCAESQAWQEAQGVSQLEHGAQQPFYQSLALDAAGTRYVAHENIDCLSDRPLEEISLELQARIMRLVAKPSAAKSWLDVRGHATEVRQGLIEERPEVLRPELQKILMVGRYFERFDWDRWRFVPVTSSE